MYQSLGNMFGKKALPGPPTRGTDLMVVNPSEVLQVLPQMLNPQQAIDITNYLVTSDSGLIKRGGLVGLFDLAGTDGITMLEKFDDDHYIYAYGTNVAVYQKSTDLHTIIKSDFTSSDPFSGQEAAGYFYVCNGGDKIGRISRTITWDTQTANFNVGSKLTGQTSGATGIITENSDSGTSGTLTLNNVQGDFQIGEIIKDNGGTPGSATATSVVTWTYTTISGAPKAKVLRVIGPRLYAGNLESDPSAVAYSNISTTYPLFNTWTVGTTASSPGSVNYPLAGSVNAIQSLGDNVIILASRGKWAFTITVQDVGGVLTKTDQNILQRVDMGGSRATVVTPGGLFYANAGGLWQIMSIGQSNIAFSQQEYEPSVLLGVSYFNDIDFTNADMTYNAKTDTVFLTCAKDATVNNFVIAYNVGAKTFSQITGWNINRFLNDNQVIYGSGAINNKVWKCFASSDDDGEPIWTNYLQEIQTGNLETRKSLLGVYASCYMFPSSTMKYNIDIFDVNGKLVTNKKQITFTPTGQFGVGRGYGEMGYGSGGYGGDEDYEAMSEMFGGCRPFIRNYQRIRLHITSADMVPHELAWTKLITKEKAVPIRRRNMTVSS